MQMIKKFFKEIDKEGIFVLLGVASIFMPYIVSGIVLLFLCARALIKKDLREKIVKCFDFKLICIFFVLNLFSPFFHKNYLGAACFLGLTVILILALYFRSVINKKTMQKAFDVMAFMSMCDALFAKMQIIGGMKRAPSVFFNPNYYGAVITLVVLICFYRIIKKEANVFFMIAAILVNFYGLLQADCQSAFFCIAFGMWLMLLLTKKYLPFAIVTVIAALMVIFLPHLTFIMPRISSFAENIALRSKIWVAGINAFKEDVLFGRGMMGYFQIYKEFGGPKNYHCHNIVIDLLLSFGVIGCVPLVIFAAKNVVIAKGKKYAPLIFAMLGAVLLHSMVDVTIAWIQTGALAALLLSLSYIKEE